MHTSRAHNGRVAGNPFRGRDKRRDGQEPRLRTTDPAQRAPHLAFQPDDLNDLAALHMAEVVR